MTIFHTRLCVGSKLKVVVVLCVCGIVINLWSFLFQPPECFDLCSYESILTPNRLTFSSSYHVQQYSEFICPQNFRNLADWIYGWPKQVFDEQLEITTTKGYHITSCLLAGSIIYVKTDYLDKFFRKVYPHLSNKFVLITGQSDASSPGRYLSHLENNDSKIIHWFGQNSEIHSSKSNKFTHIPIGINCYEMANSIRNVSQHSFNHTFASVFTGSDKPHQYSPPVDITQKILSGRPNSQLLLVNFQRMTDPTGIRSRVWEDFCNRNVTSAFVVCIDKRDGVDISALPSIYARNNQYPFWLSPRGNGLDCHRTWEALYLDVVPIVWNSTLNSLYIDLPVIILNDWSEITEEFLRTKLREITTNKSKTPLGYRFEKLRFSFWRRLILSKSRHSISTTKRENQCWRAKTSIKTD